ncbi:Zn-ribbon domain-containing OB-fold protein [Pseudoteredinibacter isoporae]|uniref:Zn-ribbon domain-containing OB-fold protein n=1 Tax=Pseudoteredinibacter isoporae TaxID=570281 RepID=UPI003107304A
MGQSINGHGPWAEYQQRLNAGQFCIQQGGNGHYFFYPRVNTPAIGGDDWQWVEASGQASIYSLSRIPQRPERGGDYYVAIVQLAEGPRLMSQLRLSSEVPPVIGDSVRAHIEHSEDADALLVFQHGEAV